MLMPQTSFLSVFADVEISSSPIFRTEKEDQLERVGPFSFPQVSHRGRFSLTHFESLGTFQFDSF